MKHYAYIILILALLAFGKWYTDHAHDAGYNEAVASYESALRQELNDQVAKNVLLTAENSQLVTDLLNKQPEIRTVYKTIEKKVNVYVKENLACNLTRGAISLRNRAGDPEQLQPGYHPALSEAEAGRSSTITQRAAEQQVHEWGELYTGLSDRYLTLLNICENNN
jgi:hypothetical protein